MLVHVRGSKDCCLDCIDIFTLVPHSKPDESRNRDIRAVPTAPILDISVNFFLRDACDIFPVLLEPVL